MLIEIAKTIIAKIINAGLHVLFILPRKKNRIVFIPSNGHYYCNLKYIDQFLRKEKADVEIIWGEETGRRRIVSGGSGMPFSV